MSTKLRSILISINKMLNPNFCNGVSYRAYFKLRFTIHNLFQLIDFKISKIENIYVVQYHNTICKFPLNPFHEISFTIKGYFKKYAPKPGDIVIDGGAYPGEFTLMSSICVGNVGKVIAFEPDPVHYKYMQELLAMNNIHNVILLNMGMWDTQGTIQFNSKNTIGSSFIFDQNSSTNIHDVEVVTIDTIVKKLGIHRIDLIKMDVEGAEERALIGAKKMLCNGHIIHLAIASYHVVNGVRTHYAVEKFLHGIGYSVNTEDLSSISTDDINLITFADNTNNE